MKHMHPSRMPTAEELEDRFTAYVRSLGGERVTDLFSDQSQLPTNADFLLWNRSVVAELKCIDTDHSSDPAMGQKLTEMLNRWRSEGPIPDSNIEGNRISTAGMPAPLVREALDILCAGLPSKMRDASKQIRYTKERLGLPNARGLVIIANLADRRLEPDFAGHLLSRALRNHTRSIHSFVFFAPRIDPGRMRGTSLWMSGVTATSEEGVPADALHQLGVGWDKFNTPLRASSNP